MRERENERTRERENKRIRERVNKGMKMGEKERRRE